MIDKGKQVLDEYSISFSRPDNQAESSGQQD